MNNNFPNSNFFQTTPQKDDKKPIWGDSTFGSGINSTGINPMNSQNPVPFGQQANPIFGGQQNTTPFSGQPSTTFNSQQNNPFGQRLNSFAPPTAFSQPNTTQIQPFTPQPTQPFGSLSFGQGSNTFAPPSNTFQPSGFNQPSQFSTQNSTAFPSISQNSFSAPGFMGVNKVGAPSNQPFGFGSIPNTWSATKGSKAFPYKETSIRDDIGSYMNLVDITGMKEYQDRSVDEIRKEDYDSGLVSSKTSTNFSFGTENKTSMGVGGGFGQSNNTLTNNQNLSTNPSFSNTFQPLNNNPVLSFGSTPSQPSIFGQTLPSNQSTVAPNPFSQSSLISNISPQPFQPVQSSGSTIQPTPFSSINQPSINPNQSNIFSKPVGSDSSMFQFNKPTETFNQSVPSVNPFRNTSLLNNPFSGSSQTNTVNNNSFNIPTTFGQSTQTVDLSDPYLLKHLKFEKQDVQKPSVKFLLPTPIFDSKKESFLDFKIRAPKVLSVNSIYTIPNLEDLDLTKPVENLIVGFEGKGKIQYLEAVSLKSFSDIEKKILLKNQTVQVSDPISTGLNKKARVFIENYFPVSKVNNEIIKGRVEEFPQKGIQERFIYHLKNDATKRFVDYNVDTGVYIYEVNHF